MNYVSWKYCKYEKIYIFMAPLVKYLWWLIKCNFPDFSSKNLNWSIFSMIKHFTETSILKVYFQITLYLLLLQIIFRLSCYATSLYKFPHITLIKTSIATCYIWLVLNILPFKTFFVWLLFFLFRHDALF